MYYPTYNLPVLPALSYSRLLHHPVVSPASPVNEVRNTTLDAPNIPAHHTPLHALKILKPAKRLAGQRWVSMIAATILHLPPTWLRSDHAVASRENPQLA